MNTEIRSTNPVVKAIVEGTAPKPAQLAAARGMLPLPQADLVEALVILAKSVDKELSETAEATLKSQDENELKNLISSTETAPHILDYFTTRADFSDNISEAVIQNPKITEQEVEGISKMRTVPEDVLRQIAINRKWARNYVIFYNLALNPRTPVSNAMNILPCLQLRDLISMTKNRNVPDAIRKHAQRLSSARVGR